MAKILRGCL